MYKIYLIILFLLPPLYLLYFIAMYLRTKVPYVATPKRYFSLIFKNINITPRTIIYELGCGKGDFLFAAEKFNPQELVGFELSPLHAFWGKIKAKGLKSKVKILCQNFFKANIQEADIIYLFLVKPVLLKVWQKLREEAKKGAIVIILSDAIPGVSYKKMIDTNPDKKKSSKIYIYQL